VFLCLSVSLSRTLSLTLCHCLSATLSETGQRVAVKIMEVQAEKLRQLERESVIQHSVVHPNVVQCIGRHLTDDGKMFVVMELVTGGELFQYLIKNGKMPDDTARKLFRQLISALSCCHSLNICHRDIKPENLMLDDEGNLKLGDFGYAQWMHCISDKTPGWVETSCGSPHYAAPEVIRGGRYVGKQADVWSSGVVLFALLTGGLPFDHENTRQLLRKVCEGKYSIPHWVTPAAADLIRRMMTVDPAQRITIDDIGAPHWHFVPCHSFSHTNLKSPTDGTGMHPWFLDGDVPQDPAPAVVQVGRFSCQAAQAPEETDGPVVLDAPPQPIILEPPPVPVACENEYAAAMQCEGQVGHALGEAAPAHAALHQPPPMDAVMELW
jgi:serine/threonine protein kinase